MLYRVANNLRQIQQLQLGTSQPLGFSVMALVQVFTSLGLALYTNWKLTFVVLSVIPVIVVIVGILSRRTQVYIESHEVKLTYATKLAHNSITNIVTVKYFNTQDQEGAAYIVAVDEAAIFAAKSALVRASQSGFVRFASTIIFVQGKFTNLFRLFQWPDLLQVQAGFWYGGTQVHSNSTTAGHVITTFWACLLASKGLEDVLPQMVVLARGRVAALSLMAVLSKVVEAKTPSQKTEGLCPQFCEGAVEMRDVSQPPVIGEMFLSEGKR
jgi:ATP-binding cassette subfamily B (MDR/TAP) protein 1